MTSRATTSNDDNTATDDAWSAQASLYANQASRLTELHGADLVTILKEDILRAKTILDIGCGTGAFAKAYVQQFPRGVPGQTLILTDLSPGMLDKAKETVQPGPDFATKLIFQQEDGTKLDGIDDGSIDLVVSLFGVFLIPDQPATLAAIRRVLRGKDAVFANASWMFNISDSLSQQGFGVSLQDAFQLPHDVITPGKEQQVNILQWSTQSRIQEIFGGYPIQCHQALHTSVWEWDNLWQMMVQNPMSAISTASEEDAAKAKASLAEFVTQGRGGASLQDPLMLSTASLLAVVRGFGGDGEKEAS